MVGVLVADDRTPFRVAVRAIVGATPGFRLLAEARSGEEAVALSRTLEPDVVLMDIKMPGIGGIEATRRITAGRDSTLVVLLSSYRERDLPAEARACGAAAYVPKEGFGRRVLEEVWTTGRASAAAPKGTEGPL
jgi:two-component system, NarL family, invasion response regulator UvrY